MDACRETKKVKLISSHATRLFACGPSFLPAITINITRPARLGTNTEYHKPPAYTGYTKGSRAASERHARVQVVSFMSVTNESTLLRSKQQAQRKIAPSPVHSRVHHMCFPRTFAAPKPQVIITASSWSRLTAQRRSSARRSERSPSNLSDETRNESRAWQFSGYLAWHPLPSFPS